KPRSAGRWDTCHSPTRRAEKRRGVRYPHLYSESEPAEPQPHAASFSIPQTAWDLKSPRQQQQFPRSLSPFQIAVRLLRFGQRIDMFDPQLEFAVANHAEDRSGTLLQLLSGRNVVPQRRPRQKDRSLLRQHQRIKRRDRPTRPTIEHHHAARTQQIQTLVECRFPYRVIDDIDALAAGAFFGDQAFRLRLKIHLRIKNYVVRS